MAVASAVSWSASSSGSSASGSYSSSAGDDLLGPVGTALANAGALADPTAQVVELGAPNVASSGHLDPLDLRRVQRERTLDADPEGLLADGERLARAVSLALDHDAFEHLRAAARSLDHLEVHAHAIAGVERRNAAELSALQAVDHGAHGECKRRPQR